ncbi:MAG: hypothetical protein LBJ91_04545 [Clostridiales Family XIII bacterium]|nr:hypothetical protein [Clostridiales Family XIII bacterium]
MRIVLTGISCVGKTTTGRLLAEKLEYSFVDFDEEVTKRMGKPLAFLKDEAFNEHGYRNMVKHIIPEILKEHPGRLVLAMPPGGLFREYKTVFDRNPDIITVWLKDSAKNILKRIVFTDDYDNPLEVELSERELRYYFNDIKKDIEYYRSTHSKAKLHFSVDGLSAEEAADGLILAMGVTGQSR